MINLHRKRRVVRERSTDGLTTELETTLNLRERVSQVARKCEVITRPDDKYSYQCVLTIAINDKHEKNRTDGLKMFSRWTRKRSLPTRITAKLARNGNDRIRPDEKYSYQWIDNEAINTKNTGKRTDGTIFKENKSDRTQLFSNVCCSSRPAEIRGSIRVISGKVRLCRGENSQLVSRL